MLVMLAPDAACSLSRCHCVVAQRFWRVHNYYVWRMGKRQHAAEARAEAE